MPSGSHVILTTQLLIKSFMSTFLLKCSYHKNSRMQNKWKHKMWCSLPCHRAIMSFMWHFMPLLIMCSCVDYIHYIILSQIFIFKYTVDIFQCDYLTIVKIFILAVEITCNSTTTSFHCAIYCVHCHGALECCEMFDGHSFILAGPKVPRVECTDLI